MEQKPRKISRRLVGFFADSIWDKLMDEYGERFSESVYFAKDEPEFVEEMERIEQGDHYGKLSKLVMEELSVAFKQY